MTLSDRPLAVFERNLEYARRGTRRARHRAVLDRRNRIAHEADLDPTTGRRHPTTWQEAGDAVAWIDDLGHALHTVITQH